MEKIYSPVNMGRTYYFFYHQGVKEHCLVVIWRDSIPSSPFFHHCGH